MSEQQHDGTGRAEPEADRPAIPRSYGIERGPEGMLPWGWADERLAGARNYWICTTRPDGRPHAAPVWGAWVDGTLYFGSGARSVKARNLAANPAVVVHLESGDDAVIVEGTAELITSFAPALFARIGDAYAAKYDGFRPDAGDPLYAVRPRVAFAWQERGYPRTATRYRFADVGDG